MDGLPPTHVKVRSFVSRRALTRAVLLCRKAWIEEKCIMEKHVPTMELVVRHVKAHITSESKKHMKEQFKNNTEGNEK